MKKALVFSALVLASGSCFAGGFADGNIDLADWVVTNPPKTSDAKSTEMKGEFSASNPDLYGWVLENLPKGSDEDAPAGKPVAFSKGNPDLFGWVVNDVKHG